MTTAGGRQTVAYLVRCALPAGRTLVKKDQIGVSHSFSGKIGLAPQWENAACDTNCQELISSCMMAHVNTTGRNVKLWMVSTSATIGWGTTLDYPYQEGSFFGNIFVSPPQAYYCNGSDVDAAVVAGRIGANQINAPYKNPFPGQGFCRNSCTASTGNARHVDIDGNTVSDGFTACKGFKNIITTYRDFDPASNQKICNRKSGLCLDVVGKSTASGAASHQTAYAGQLNQKFGIAHFQSPYPGFMPWYAICNRNGGKCLAVPTWNTFASGDFPVKLVTLDAGTNSDTDIWASQHWQFRPTGEGYYQISTVAGWLSVKGASTASGASIITRDSYAGQSDQQWTIQMTD
ncbi:MAG: RICIN domain-containing protein [Deltaproteobacteria bacterium]|nr:RICIN domain-containing protein [Deltaproteobacteria bacterium]